jgi:hypothetical protein
MSNGGCVLHSIAPISDVCRSYPALPGESTCQADVFEDLRFIVQAALDGYNGTIMGEQAQH